MTKIYQLKTGFFVEDRIDTLGSYLKYSSYELEDDNVLDPALMDIYDSHPPYKIPLEMWDQMVTLFMYYVSQHTEVQARFYVRDSEFICIVPKQKVTGGSVDYDYTQPLYDISGNSYTIEWLAENDFVLFGHFHLHPFDMADPSGTDDKNELDTPALFGIISLPAKRNSNEYRIKTTVVANDGYRNRRYHVNPWEFINLKEKNYIQTHQASWFSEKVLTQVSKFTYVPPTYHAGRAIVPHTTYKKREENIGLQQLLAEAFQDILMQNSNLTTSDIALEMYSALSLVRKQEELFTYDIDNYDYI